MENVRWGLVSTAHINRRLIPAIRASRQGVLAAVASRTLDHARRYARQWHIPAAFGSYQAMLDSGQVDAVYISLPNHLHAAWSVRALQAGLHVLCEKPFAASVQQVEEMIAAAQDNRRVLAEAFMYRHHPQTKLVGAWVRSGKLGQLQLVRGVFSFQIKSPDDIRLQPAMGGGSLWDIGIYPLSMAQYLYGSPPQAVSALQQTGPSGVDEAFTGSLRYPGGGLAQIAASFRAPLHTEVDIIGASGRLLVTRPFTHIQPPESQVIFFPAEGEAQELVAPEQDLYLGEIEDMHAAILNGQAPCISLEESRNHVRTAAALYQAAASGREVLL